MLPLSKALWESISVPLTLPKPIPLTKSGSSWVLHIPKFFRPPTRQDLQTVFESHPSEYHALFLFGKKHFENRFSQFYHVLPPPPSPSKDSAGSSSHSHSSVVEETNVRTMLDQKKPGDQDTNYYTYSGSRRQAICCNPQVEEQEFIIQLCRISDQIISQLMEDGWVPPQEPSANDPNNNNNKKKEDTRRRKRRSGSPGSTESSNSDNSINSDHNTKSPPCYYNACLMNWYRPEHSIGLHADDEREMRPNLPIVSLSWGGPRRFLLRPKSSPNGVQPNEKVKEILLRDGDLLIMGGKCQQEFKHEVPRVRKKDGLIGERISWTIRSMQNVKKGNRSATPNKSEQKNSRSNVSNNIQGTKRKRWQC